MRLRYLVLFFVFAVLMQAQAPKRTAPFSIRGTIGIPRTVSSQMFRTSFNGVYEGSLSFNARIIDNFFAGIGYQSTLLQNNKGVFASKIFLDKNGNPTGAAISYQTKLLAHAGFIKIGFDKFFDKGYMSYALNIGQMYAAYTKVNGDTSKANQPFVPQKFSAPYLQPEMGINFMTDGRLTFSLLFSYTTLFYNFDPKAPRFNHFAEVNESKNKYFMSWINIGFGFNVLLGKM